MTYVFLVYQDAAMVNALEPCRRDAIMVEAAAYREQLRQCGQLLLAVALPAAALTVRPPGGAVEIGDASGLLADARLTAIWLTEARDLNEAIRLAARMPEAPFCRIEVRAAAAEESGR